MDLGSNEEGDDLLERLAHVEHAEVEAKVHAVPRDLTYRHTIRHAPSDTPEAQA